MGSQRAIVAPSAVEVGSPSPCSAVWPYVPITWRTLRALSRQRHGRRGFDVDGRGDRETAVFRKGRTITQVLEVLSLTDCSIGGV